MFKIEKKAKKLRQIFFTLMPAINLNDFWGESKEIISETVEITDGKIHVVLFGKVRSDNVNCRNRSTYL